MDLRKITSFVVLGAMMVAVLAGCSAPAEESAPVEEVEAEPYEIAV